MVHLLELQEVERDHVSCMSIRSSLWQKNLRTLSFLCSSNALQSIKRNASILQVPGMERDALSLQVIHLIPRTTVLEDVQWVLKISDFTSHFKLRTEGTP